MKEKRSEDPELLTMCAWERESSAVTEVFHDFRYAELAGEDFSRLNLRYFILSHVNFYKAILYRARLEEASLD